MAKLVEAVKKAVTKKPVVKKEEVKQPSTCSDCNGKGLLDKDTLCPACKGSGQV